MFKAEKSAEMGQLPSHQVAEERVPFDENGDNGLILCDHYIPEELLCELFCYVEPKTLLNCQLVCKKWLSLMRDYVWRKKAERVFGASLKAVKNSPWITFYNISQKSGFERNLVKNHSGQDGLTQHWNVIQHGGDLWTVEAEPAGTPPLPDDPVFEGATSCFVTSYSNCVKQQIIDLMAEGLLPHILDEYKPPILISEWYSCRWDCPAIYECTIEFLGETGNILSVYRFHDRLVGEKQNKWHHFCYAFENYAPGLRKIAFTHAGRDASFWAGHYGSKMAGASVVVKLKPFDRSIVTSNESTSNNGNGFLYTNDPFPNRRIAYFPDDDSDNSDFDDDEDL